MSKAALPRRRKIDEGHGNDYLTAKITVELRTSGLAFFHCRCDKLSLLAGHWLSAELHVYIAVALQLGLRLQCRAEVWRCHRAQTGSEYNSSAHALLLMALFSCMALVFRM
jgi:hypothetical protein